MSVLAGINKPELGSSPKREASSLFMSYLTHWTEQRYSHTFLVLKNEIIHNDDEIEASITF